MKKEKASVMFRRLTSGKVLGEIIDETGRTVVSKNFGVMSEEAYQRFLGLVEEQHREMSSADSIELSNN